MNIYRRFLSEYSQVTRAADKQTAEVFRTFGAFTRRTAKGLIRKAKSPSAPGRPPHSHLGLLKKFIFFAWDAGRRSVIIGPAKINGTVSDEAPHALEHGGRTTVVRGSRRRPRVEEVTIAARPFIGPAAATNIKKLPTMWAQAKPAKVTT